jgi:N-acetyl-1-D-myo-inositol-2-amino-2-deoxy-alpha-D-glucopyranoside deacetylase
MAVHAHPDDEVFSTGGILAKYAHEGDRVVVVYGTNGEAGEMHDPERDPEEAKPRLGEIRREEALEANRILGVTDVYFLGYRDSGMKDTEENKNPANYKNAPLEEAAERLMAIMRETRPQVVVTYDPGGGYGHPDHIQTNRVSVEAFCRLQDEPWSPQKLYYSARSREWFRRYVTAMRAHGLEIPWVKSDFNFDEFGVPDAEITAHIDVSKYVALKKAALAAHRTQIPADFFYLRIPDEALIEGSGVEHFMRIFPPHQPGEREGDLFDGIEDRSAAA